MLIKRSGIFFLSIYILYIYEYSYENGTNYIYGTIRNSLVQVRGNPATARLGLPSHLRELHQRQLHHLLVKMEMKINLTPQPKVEKKTTCKMVRTGDREGDANEGDGEGDGDSDRHGDGDYVDTSDAPEGAEAPDGLLDDEYEIEKIYIEMQRPRGQPMQCQWWLVGG